MYASRCHPVLTRIQVDLSPRIQHGNRARIEEMHRAQKPRLIGMVRNPDVISIGRRCLNGTNGQLECEQFALPIKLMLMCYTCHVGHHILKLTKQLNLAAEKVRDRCAKLRDTAFGDRHWIIFGEKGTFINIVHL